MSDALVLGAGLAGLTAAYHLHRAGRPVRVLEARDRIGGRAFGIAQGAGGIDLGPAWIWPAHQPLVMALLGDLGLEVLAQYEDGDFLHDTHAGMQRGTIPPRYGDAARIRRGVGALARRLADTLPAGAIRLGHVVRSLDLRAAPRVTTADGAVHEGAAVICAVPGPLVADWQVVPDLASDLRADLTRWPTWMAAHAKVVALYDRPFWRDAGLSGSVISQRGPLVEIADQSDPDAGLFGLFGFVGVPHAARRDADALLAQVRAQLVRLFGPEAAAPRTLTLHDWADEAFTTTPADRIPPAGHPPYGAPALSRPVGTRLFLAGAEVSARNGGLIEGAIETGTRAAAQAGAVLDPPG